MFGRVRRGYALLVVAGALLCCGCWGGAANPSYFPYYLPPGDIIQTHAKPPGLGYFANFDRRAVAIEVIPEKCSNPIGTDMVIIATVFDETDKPRRKRRVEWILEGPGELLEVDESGYTAGRGYLMSNTRGVTYTSMRQHTFTRGNDNPDDDFAIEPGQTWCIVRSMKPGETIVTAYAPEIFNHDRRTAISRLTWTENGSLGRSRPLSPNELPEPRFTPPRANNPASQNFPEKLAPEEVPLSTAPMGTAVQPARYSRNPPEVLLRLPASVPFNQPATIELQLQNRSDETWDSVVLELTLPRAAEYLEADLAPTARSEQQLFWTVGGVSPGQQITRRVQVRPQRRGELEVQATARFSDGTTSTNRATTTVGGGTLQLNLEVPEAATASQPIPIGLLVRNPGTTTVEQTITWVTLPQGLTHESGKSIVEVRHGSIRPDKQHRGTLELQATKPGRYTLRANTVANGGLSAQSEVILEVTEFSIVLRLEGPSNLTAHEPTPRRAIITNGGTTALEQVELLVKLPPGWRARKVEGNQPEAANALAWQLPQLAPGTQSVFNFFVIPTETGSSRSLVLTAKHNGRSIETTQSVNVAEPAALQLDSLSLPASLAAGETIRVPITIRNVGRGVARNLDFTLEVTDGVQLVSGQGPNRREVEPSEQQLRYGVITELPPGQTVTFTATLRGGTPGEARIRASLYATGLTQPLRDEQALRIRAKERP